MRRRMADRNDTQYVTESMLHACMSYGRGGRRREMQAAAGGREVRRRLEGRRWLEGRRGREDARHVGAGGAPGKECGGGMECGGWRAGGGRARRNGQRRLEGSGGGRPCSRRRWDRSTETWRDGEIFDVAEMREITG
ncbi:hypothetical protein BRADI_1g29053v3 [Brachypodium distachyon]|uniref:Uncharacterized protein n=1 Tax=Brachypodium distachyon TaxID=15368 RepID=A0A0Q3JWN7_BRADI|nr:hypothetical protein BRADI_1g29053v3 [Brachypodium distachyon]